MDCKSGDLGSGLSLAASSPCDWVGYNSTLASVCPSVEGRMGLYMLSMGSYSSDRLATVGAGLRKEQKREGNTGVSI